jgi:chlorophyll(ide) b reductase
MKSFTYVLLALAPTLSSAFAPISNGVTTRPASSLNAMPDGGVVITGSAGGVGFAYAGEFMDRGYDVVICDVKDCTAAAKALTARHPNGNVFHTKCDVSDAASCEKLGQFAQEKLGNIGYWINNAGINGGRRALTELSMQQVETVVKVNLLGIFYCTKVAMDIMAEQEGFTGHIFNTVGSGVKGGGTPGYATYGATKRGLPQLTASLVKEIDEGVQGYEKKTTKGTIQVHSLSPGMVFTKLLLDDSTPELRKFPFGVLAAQPEEVAADLVPKILAQKSNGGIVEFLTTDRILTKFFERFILQKKSEYIDDDGNVIKVPGEQYDPDGVRALY